MCDVWLVKRQLIPSQSIYLCLFSEDIFWLRVITAAGHSANQAGKNPQGKWGGFTLSDRNPASSRLLTPSFLSYLANLISSLFTQTKPLPRTVSQGVRRTKATQTQLLSCLTGPVQLPYSWIASCRLSQWNYNYKYNSVGVIFIIVCHAWKGLDLIPWIYSF